MPYFLVLSLEKLIFLKQFAYLEGIIDVWRRLYLYSFILFRGGGFTTADLDARPSRWFLFFSQLLWIFWSMYWENYMKRFKYFTMLGFSLRALWGCRWLWGCGWVFKWSRCSKPSETRVDTLHVKSKCPILLRNLMIYWSLSAILAIKSSICFWPTDLACSNLALTSSRWAVYFFEF